MRKKKVHALREARRLLFLTRNSNLGWCPIKLVLFVSSPKLSTRTILHSLRG